MCVYSLGEAARKISSSLLGTLPGDVRENDLAAFLTGTDRFLAAVLQEQWRATHVTILPWSLEF